MKKIIRFFLTILLTGCWVSCRNAENISRADLVDMFMGVQGFSNCVIGPQLPHGSVNPAPQTPNGFHDGYDPADPIRGFGQLHVSGIGWGRYGQVFLSPQTGFDASETGHDSPKSNETATPYYYAVHLDRYDIFTELTPTHHCVSYRFTYPVEQEANLLLDMAHNIPQHIVPIVEGRFLGGSMVYDAGADLLSGWGEYMGGFGSQQPYKVYFAIQLGVKPQDVAITDRGDAALYARIKFPEKTGTVMANVGISMKSEANAVRYLSAEIGDRDFEDIKNTARQIWNRTLSGIDIQGGTLDEQRLFYTAMYHSFVMPRDRSGDNPNWDSDNPHFDDHYCVWDTWRTKFPLMLLLDEPFVVRNIQSFIDRYEHDSIVTPTYTSSLEWEAIRKQGGDDVDNVIADVFVKKVGGFDREKAYELIRRHASCDRSPDYLRLGWEPEPALQMSCSYTMEYAYNDFCAATVALAMNDTVTADSLMARSGKWVNLFNKEAESFGFKGFIAPRKENGEWLGIDPAKRYGPWTTYFYEGNSWVYTLFTPHQFDRLIGLCGGKETMVDRLIYGFEHDLMELDNEPGFLSPFIFIHCDRPDLTAKYVKMIRDNHFSLTTGYPENEDSGAMGAWYVFTSIGFFPNAGQDYYYLLPPAFPEIRMVRENGKIIHIQTKKSTPDARELDYVMLNGKKLDRAYIYHDEIADGATLIYMMK